MKSNCPTSDELLRFVDGELTQNHATRLQDHSLECAECSAQIDEWQKLVAGIGTEVGGREVPTVTAELFRQISAEHRPPERRRPRVAWAGAFGVAVAVAAATLYLTTRPRPAEPGDEFRARSGTREGTGPRAELRRSVGLQFYSVRDHKLKKLAAGALVRADDALTISTIDSATKPVYALVFAVDRAGEAHWLFPEYSDRATNPRAIELPVSGDEETVHAESVQLDGAATGAMLLVAVLSHKRLAVSDIESIPREARSVQALQARWPHAHIEAVSVRFSVP